MKKKSFPITNIGSVSLMMIFIVLCLVTFATLSLSSATSDYHFSQKIAAHNTRYYEASNEASSRIADIELLLEKAYAQSPGNYFAAAQETLNTSGLCETTLDNKTLTAAFQIPVNDTQMLSVVLTLNTPETLSEGYYRITSWQEVSSSEWESDSSLKLFK